MKKYKVNIEVRGGVVEVTKCPKEVEVIIKDHDIEKEIHTEHESDLKVIVYVKGGVATVTECPPNVDVKIDDLD